jgi:hydroxypyruvate reductase
MAQSKPFLKDLFTIAVNESLSSVCMPKHLSNIDASNGLCIIGAGKASVDMAETIYQRFGEKCYGTIVTRHGYTEKSSIGRIQILSAGHPIPDEGSLHAGQEILALAKRTPKDVPVLFLISGGASAMMSLPIDEISFEEKMQLNQFLLASGASINEINVVRKQLSKIKGGKLAQAIKGKYQTLIISDVVGDDLSTIASGPTVKDNSTRTQALAVLNKYHWHPIETVEQFLQTNDENSIKLNSIPSETVTIMANARNSIDKAISCVDHDQWHTSVLDYDEVGDANVVAKQHAKIALQAKASGLPTLLFSGGELTVTLCENSGQGGPNQQYMLALAAEINGIKGISALACDTDGIDGSEDVAGAFIDATTIARASEKKISIEKHLRHNDCYNFFKQLDDLIITGPTHTNVNDFRVIMVEP